MLCCSLAQDMGTEPPLRVEMDCPLQVGQRDLPLPPLRAWIDYELLGEHMLQARKDRLDELQKTDDTSHLPRWLVLTYVQACHRLLQGERSLSPPKFPADDLREVEAWAEALERTTSETMNQAVHAWCREVIELVPEALDEAAAKVWREAVRARVLSPEEEYLRLLNFGGADAIRVHAIVGETVARRIIEERQRRLFAGLDELPARVGMRKSSLAKLRAKLAEKSKA